MGRWSYYVGARVLLVSQHNKVRYSATQPKTEHWKIFPPSQSYGSSASVNDQYGVISSSAGSPGPAAPVGRPKAACLAESRAPRAALKRRHPEGESHSVADPLENQVRIGTYLTY